MNDTDKDLEIKELTDKYHTHNLKINIILGIKYLVLGFSILLLIILISSLVGI